MTTPEAKRPLLELMLPRGLESVTRPTEYSGHTPEPTNCAEIFDAAPIDADPNSRDCFATEHPIPKLT